MKKSPLIFDYQSTTPCGEEVVEVMRPYWSEFWGNPSLRNNRLNLQAAAAISLARDQIASIFSIDSERIVFTSGATEANNLALLGFARGNALKTGRLGHLITIATEHKAVLAPLRQLQREGFSLTELIPSQDGLISIDQLADAMRKETILVSIMSANNEIGVLQPMADISNLCRNCGVTLHTDYSQAFGYLNIKPDDLNLDMISISGHKIYGPKGIGLLVTKPSLPLLPLQWGGNQENGLRPGTLPVPLIIGLAKSMELASQNIETRNQKYRALRNQLWERLNHKVSGLKINGSWERRLPHNLNFSVDGVNGNRLHRNLKPLISCSSGSACSNGEASHVLMAIGLKKQAAEASLRLSIGKKTTINDVEKAVDIISDLLISLRD